MERFEIFITMLFITFVLHQKINIAFRLKKTFGVIHKEVKPLDCYPCFAFWISLLTFDIFIAMSIFLTSVVIDRINN